MGLAEKVIYCTLLNPAFDLIYPVERFVPGETRRDVACRRFCAGKGINVARVVRTLGEEVCVIGVMPEEEESRFVSYLESREIYYRFFTVPGAVRLNVTIVEKEQGRASHLNSGSPKVSHQVQNAFMRFVGDHLAAGDLWCFCGSIVTGFDDDLYGKMIRRCREAGVDTFLDTRGKPLRYGVRARPAALKPNIAELEELYEEKIRGVRHMALKGKKLLDRGVPYVFISLGYDGMMALHGNECLLCVPPQVRSVDTVGCGDALMAGVLVGWQRCLSFREICRLATACGASKAMHEGPHTVSKEEVKRLMGDVKITAV
jgi:1-phosphofructokinase family hexose kinase